MNELERHILGSASLKEAADFYLQLKRPFAEQCKTAAMSDAPDETGELEGCFAVPVEHLAALLADVAKASMSLMLASMLYEMSLRGSGSEVLKRVICSSEYEYRGLVDYCIRRASVLSGAVHVDGVEPPPSCTCPRTAARNLIRGNQELIALLREVDAAAGDNVMRRSIQNFSSSAQERVDNLWRTLDKEVHVPPVPLAFPEALEGERVESVHAVPEPSMGDSTKVAEPSVEDVRKALEAGLLRGVTQANKDVVVDLGHRGERTGKAVGRVGGALAGAALGHRYVGGPAGTAVGAGIGYLAGGDAGKELGRSRDVRLARMRAGTPIKKAAATLRVRLLAEKLGTGMGAPGAASAPMSSPSSFSDVHASNYLDAELAGQRAQDASEASYHRQRAAEAENAAQAAQAQMVEVQSQLAQLQAQAQGASQQVQQATQEALAAQDEALKQTQVAANMRMGMQKLRAAMLDVASQDPAEVAASELQAQAVPPSADAPVAPQGPAAEAGQAPAMPGAVPPGGGMEAPPQLPVGEGAGADPSTAAPASSMKLSNLAMERAGGALVGAGVGALHARELTMSVPLRRKQLRELEEKEQSGFFQAMRLAAAKARLSSAEVAERHPVPTIITGAAKGALVGATAAPSIVSNTNSAIRGILG